MEPDTEGLVTACGHPLNDQVVLAYSLVQKDFFVGLETSTLGYYCQEHRRFGVWKTEKPCRKVDVEGLADQDRGAGPGGESFNKR